ncbi:MAG: leucyl/phenylalanyl-tRNA--protein transferase [Propionibacteriales bacterium]|nr:leucyl/phenylalanyl-tRNA--protein transferase [Propionibacteriales bacterium]
MPIEPPESPWEIPSPKSAGDEDLVGGGADLEPGTVLAAYRAGIFPMPVEGVAHMLWWSPAMRGVLPPDGLRVSRSLRQSCKRFEIRVDTACHEVIKACADPARPGGWINDDIIAAYTRLHELGWVHSVEAWNAEGELAGGLYGVAIGGLFAGESMFYRQRDASKVALVGLVDIVRAANPDGRLIDVQWQTKHLQSLGVIDVPRKRYLQLLDSALQLPLPEPFA